MIIQTYTHLSCKMCSVHCMGLILMNWACIRVLGLAFCHSLVWDDDQGQEKNIDSYCDHSYQILYSFNLCSSVFLNFWLFENCTSNAVLAVIVQLPHFVRIRRFEWRHRNHESQSLKLLMGLFNFHIIFCRLLYSICQWATHHKCPDLNLYMCI